MRSIELETDAEEGTKFNLWTLFWDNTDLRVGRRIRISFLVLSIQQMMGMQFESTTIYLR
jgi:hypothetical protein